MRARELAAILRNWPDMLVTVYDGHGAGSTDLQIVTSEVLVDDRSGQYEPCIHLQDKTYPTGDRDELDAVVKDLSIMVRRLIGGKAAISQKTKDQCWDYLQRKGLQGSILR